MVTVEISTKVTQGKTEEFLNSVDAVHELLNETKGFIGYATYQPIDSPDIFNIHHKWQSAADVKLYIASEEFDAFIGGLKLLTTETEITCKLCNSKNFNRSDNQAVNILTDK